MDDCLIPVSLIARLRLPFTYTKPERTETRRRCLAAEAEIWVGFPRV